jgi:hypothetical protein
MPPDPQRADVAARPADAFPDRPIFDTERPGRRIDQVPVLAESSWRRRRGTRGHLDQLSPTLSQRSTECRQALTLWHEGTGARRDVQSEDRGDRIPRLTHRGGVVDPEVGHQNQVGLQQPAGLHEVVLRVDAHDLDHRGIHAQLCTQTEDVFLLDNRRATAPADPPLRTVRQYQNRLGPGGLGQNPSSALP